MESLFGFGWSTKQLAPSFPLGGLAPILYPGRRRLTWSHEPTKMCQVPCGQITPSSDRSMDKDRKSLVDLGASSIVTTEECTTKLTREFGVVLHTVSQISLMLETVP